MPPENSEKNFSADDLASLGETPADDGGESAGEKAAAEAKPAAAKEPPPAKEPAKEPPAEGKDAKPATIATGADTEKEAAEKAKAEEKAKPYWPEDWREKLAEHIAAGDKKAYARELKRLERIADPSGVYGMYREAEGKLTSGGLIKKPGKDAKPEEIAEYHKALGVPEKPEDYFKDIKLENGAVIGEADKPLVDGFAAAVHKSGATPQFVNAALNWYYQNQEEQAAAMDEADDDHRRESERALKDEYGAAFKRKTNAIASIFATAPGGSDIDNHTSLYSRLMGGRTADGKLIGNDPDMVRWLVAMAHEVNPVATVVEDGAGLKGAQARLDEIRALRKTDTRRYWREDTQKEEAELIAAIEKDKARARA